MKSPSPAWHNVHENSEEGEFCDSIRHLSEDRQHLLLRYLKLIQLYQEAGLLTEANVILITRTFLLE
jgi:hypothetical protein